MSITNKLFEEFFRGNIEAVKKRLSFLLKKKKDDPLLWFLKALVEVRDGLYNEALSSIEKSISINKTSYEAWFLKGIILRELKSYDDAIASFDEALNIRIREEGYLDYEIEIEKAKTYIAMGDKIKARQIISKIIDLVPEDTEIKNMLSEIG